MSKSTTPVDQPIKQTTMSESASPVDQPNKQATIPPSIGQSHFEQHLRWMFISMCSYLRLDEKLSRLPMLSQTINRSFDVSRCCRNYIEFSQIDPDAASQMGTRGSDLIYENEHRTKVMPYVQYAARLNIFIYATEQPPKRRKNILLSIQRTMTNGILQALIMSEGCFSESQRLITCDLLESINKPGVQLRFLDLHLIDAYEQRPANFWGALKSAKSLQQLVVDMTHDTNLDASIVNNLPDSLQDLIVVSRTPAQVKFRVWHEAFSKDDFLPNLKRFSLRESATDPPNIPTSEFAVVIVDTLMKVSKQPRPISSYHAYTLDGLGEMAHLPITEILCGCVEKVAAAELLQHHEFLFPKLKSVAVYGSAAPTDSSALVIFAANRPIEQFGFVGQSKAHGSMSDAMVKAVAQMRGLRFLNLRNMDTLLFKTTDLTNLVPANAWPKLEHFSLYTKNPSEKQLLTLLSAMPSCRSAILRTDSTKITNATVLAMALHHCPDIIRLTIRSRGKQTPTESIESARNAFTRYPLKETSAQKLVALAMPELSCSVAVFHYILRQLMHVPRLEIASLAPAGASLLHFCCLRSLKHVRMVEQFDGPTNLRELQLPQIKSFFSKHRAHGDLAHNLFDQKFYIDERVFRYAATFDEIILEMRGATQPYTVMQQNKDEDGALFDALHNLLSASDKALLDKLDNGNYTVD